MFGFGLTHRCFFALLAGVVFQACFFIAVEMFLNSFFLALFSAMAAALSLIFAACAPGLTLFIVRVIQRHLEVFTFGLNPQFL